MITSQCPDIANWSKSLVSMSIKKKNNCFGALFVSKLPKEIMK